MARLHAISACAVRSIPMIPGLQVEEFTSRHRGMRYPQLSSGWGDWLGGAHRSSRQGRIQGPKPKYLQVSPHCFPARGRLGQVSKLVPLP